MDARPTLVGRRTRSLVLVLGILGFGGCGPEGDLSSGAASGAGSSGQNFVICHYTSSAIAPWVEITVNLGSIRTHVDHHGDHYRHLGYSCQESAAALYGESLVPGPAQGWSCLTTPGLPGCTATSAELEAARALLASRVPPPLPSGSALCDDWGLIIVDARQCDVGQALVLVYGGFTQHPTLTSPGAECRAAGVRVELDGEERFAFLCDYLENNALEYSFAVSGPGFSCAPIEVSSGCNPS